MKTISILAVLFAFGLMLTAFAPSGGVKIGDKAADFKLKNVDGKMVSLADIKDAKGAIVIFSCNHCPYVIMYEERMNALNKKYAAMGYPVVAINSNDVAAYPDDSYEKMQENYKNKDFTFLYVHDESQSIAKKYGAERTPHVYVLQKEGKNNVVKYIGAIDDNPKDASKVETKYVENAVDALIAGKDVPLAETKAVGCGIKWKK